MSTPWEAWKTVIYPGTIVVPGKKGPHRYTFKPSDIASMERNGNGKIADQWNIPICYEHQDVAPVRLSQGERDEAHARSVFGDARKFRRNPTTGRLEVLLGGPDEKDYEQFKKLKFVSPELAWDWTDTDGKIWLGPSIMHIAATAQPVQRHQEAIGTLRLSLQASSSLQELFSTLEKSVPVGGRLRLSLANYEGQHMADDAETGNDDPLFKGGGAGKKQSPWQKIAASLAEHCGLDLGDVSAITDPEQFAMIVDVAAKNYKAGQEPEADLDDELLPEDEEQPNPEDTEPPPEGTGTPPAPVQMSLKAAKERNTKLAEKLVERERDALVTRARRVAKNGSLTPADGDALVQEGETVRLSLTAAGELQRNNFIVKLEALEKVKPGTTWKPNGRGKVGVRLSQRSRPVDDSEYAAPRQVSDAKVLEDWDATLK